MPVPHRPSSGASLQDPDRSPRHPQLGNSGIVSFRGQAWDSRHPATSLSFALESILGYIRERLGHSLYIADLSRAAGLSERSIHTLFRKELGMSPMQYIKSERLLMAKRMLQDNAAGHISVKVAAISAGFRDLGRFSIEYHSMFGEAPSQTLRRCHPPQANTAAILANQVPPASPPAGSVNLR